MLAKEFLGYAEHLLRNLPFEVCGLLAVRVYAESLLYMPCKVLFLMFPRVEELGRA